MKKETKYISQVAKDIIRFRFKPSMSLRDVENGFYALMRKHGIKHCTKDDAGNLTTSNFEWTMCKDLYYNQLVNFFALRGWFGGKGGCPKDLEYYKD